MKFSPMTSGLRTMCLHGWTSSITLQSARFLLWASIRRYMVSHIARASTNSTTQKKCDANLMDTGGPVCRLKRTSPPLLGTCNVSIAHHSEHLSEPLDVRDKSDIMSGRAQAHMPMGSSDG